MVVELFFCDIEFLTCVFVVGLHLADLCERLNSFFKLSHGHVCLALSVVALDVSIVELNTLKRIEECANVVLQSQIGDGPVAIVNSLLLFGNLAINSFGVLFYGVVKLVIFERL